MYTWTFASSSARMGLAPWGLQGSLSASLWACQYFLNESFYRADNALVDYISNLWWELCDGSFVSVFNAIPCNLALKFWDVAAVRSTLMLPVVLVDNLCGYMFVSRGKCMPLPCCHQHISLRKPVDIFAGRCQWLGCHRPQVLQQRHGTCTAWKELTERNTGMAGHWPIFRLSIWVTFPGNAPNPKPSSFGNKNSGGQNTMIYPWPVFY